MSMPSTTAVIKISTQRRTLLAAAYLLLVALFVLASVGSNSELASADEQCSAVPEKSADELVGTPCDDVLIAEEGVTSIVGGGGDDEIFVGNDVVSANGGSGNDLIVGTDQPENLSGGTGTDIIFGDAVPPNIDIADIVSPEAVQYLDGTNGDDPDLFGGKGDDRINCGAGNDWAWGERGNDRIFGASGNDRLYGGVGDDLVSGQDNNDLLSGGNGNDNVLGGSGNDLVRGDTVVDNRHTYPQVEFNDPDFPDGLRGGDGTDTISFSSGVTPGFSDGDVPVDVPSTYSGFPSSTEERGIYVDFTETFTQDGLSYVRSFNGINRDGGGTDLIGVDFENIVGSAFSDYIKGDSSANVLHGNGGADVVLGMGGSDVLYGGGDSDHLDGGTGTDKTWGGSSSSTSGSSNYCTGYENGDEYNCTRNTSGVVTRSSNLLSVGVAKSGLEGNGPFYSEVYVMGGSGADSIATEYISASSPPEIEFTSTGTQFDPSQTQEQCDYSSGNLVATCELSTNYPLDSILYFGSAGNDDLRASNASLPNRATPFILGGNGSDSELQGSVNTEDVIIDGPDAGNDVSRGYDRTDSIYQGAGTDSIFGGNDGDVLYSTGLCQGNIIDGGNGEDNNTWAALPLPNRSMTAGVFANLDPTWHYAGNGGVYGIPTCTSGSVDTLDNLENLEGSNGRDYLFGNNDANSLLGRAGVDSIWGGGGNDNLHVFSDDFDQTVDCGAGSSDILRRDAPSTDGRDSVYSACEDIQNLDSEYSYTVDNTVIGNSQNDARYSTPEAYYRLDERAGTTAYTNKRATATSAFNGGATLNVTGSVPDSEGTAVRLDGTNDYINLADALDPSGYSGTGYSVEIWVKFNGSPPAVGNSEFVFSKYMSDASRGIYLYRNSSGQIVFGTKRTTGSATSVVSTSAPSSGVWHQLVGTLDGNTITLYVDGTSHSTNFSPTSAFPSSGNTASNWIGRGPIIPAWLNGDVDSFAIYGKALSSCEVNRHYDLRTAGGNIGNC